MTPLEKLNEVLMEELGLDEPPALEATLKDLGADSMDRVSLTLALEDTFHIDIPDDEAEKLLTVQSILDYITRKLPAGFKL